MTEDLLRRWPDAERILDDVLELPADERRRRALEACAGDEALRQLIERLLDGDDHDTVFPAAPIDLLSSGPENLNRADRNDGDDLPTRVGPYRVLRELGRGGMGRVLLAERADSAYAARVALKLFDFTGHSREALRRFERERETLARLRHPHIARLHDGGLTSDGVPFHVMEFVEGSPIDQHCNRLGLDINARLRLFQQIASAVEYAHGRLVVHRDLKPANVLVDDHGNVKLLDFGIAKWLARDEHAVDLDAADEVGTLTEASQRMLTPAYAAPEQFRGEATTVATDVYQLGLLLFELLTGTRAHGRSDGTAAALERATLERDPDRPSRVVVRPELAHVAQTRGTTVSGLARRLAGDLDAIVLRALRKEPAARYPTVEALRRDIDDYLAHRPVAARRGTTMYALSKYVRRHRTAAAMAGAVALSTAVGAVAFAAQSRATAIERDRAQLAEAKATAINSFLVHELLAASTPERASGQTITVADVLRNASRSVAHAFTQQPETEVDIRQTLARSYAAIGQLAEARTHATAAHALLAQARPADDLATFRAQALLAKLLLDEGRFRDARPELERLLSVQQARLGPAHADVLRTRALFGRALRELGQVAAAESTLEEALQLASRHHAGDWRLNVELRTELAETLNRLTKGMQAEAVSRELLAIQRAQLGPTHAEVARSLRLHALALTVMLRYKDAVDANREVVALHEQIYGPTHRLTAQALTALGVAHSRFNALDEARPVFERAHEIYLHALGPEHPETLRALRNVAIALRRVGKLEEAEALYRRVLATRRRSLGERHPATIESMDGLSEMLMDAGRVAEARRVGRETVRAYESIAASPDADPVMLDNYAIFLLDVQPVDVRDIPRALAIAERAVASTKRQHYLRLRTLARAQLATDQPQLAIDTVREALALPDAIQSWTLEEMFVDLLRKHGTSRELETWLLQRLDQFGRAGRPDDYLAGKTLRHLSLLYVREGRVAEAERRAAESLAQFSKTAPDSNWEVGRARSELGERLAARRAFTEAEPHLLKGFDALAADPQVRLEYLEAARGRLVTLYTAQGRGDDAQRWRARKLRHDRDQS